MSDVIRDQSPPPGTVVWKDWRRGEIRKDGRIVHHLPTGCAFLCWNDQGGDFFARHVEGEADDPETLGRIAIRFYMLSGLMP